MTWTPPSSLNPPLRSLGVDRVVGGRWAGSLRCKTCRVLWVPRRDPDKGERPVDFWVCPGECNLDVWEGLQQKWSEAGLEVPAT